MVDAERSCAAPGGPTHRRPKVVITGVNLVEGGTLTTFREMVRAAVAHEPAWEVVALVHQTGLLGVPGATEMAFPDIKRSWLKRLKFEWVDLARLSRTLGADVWISMHDITPRIRVARQFVYCHNPTAFATIPWRLSIQDKTFALSRLLYGRLYGVNIQRNTAVIVQQQWLREAFKTRYKLRQVIVAHPSGIPPSMVRAADGARPPRRFLYPTLPRVFKNIELLGEALALLETDQRWQGTVTVTIDGSEHAYAHRLVERYGRLRSLSFIGRQTHADMNRRYDEHDALIFPSLLETWGLPLTEARDRGMPVLVADLPYAHETIGTCGAVRFFDPHDAPALARHMLELSTGAVGFGTHRASRPALPYAPDWASLCTMLLAPADDRRSADRAAPQAADKAFL